MYGSFSQPLLVSVLSCCLLLLFVKVFGKPGRSWLVWALSWLLLTGLWAVHWVLPPDLQMMAFTLSFVPSRVLYVITEAGIPEALAKLGSATAEEIAAALPEPVHAPHLYRMMHFLSSLGVYKLDRRGRFSPTRVGRTLVRDKSGWSLRSCVLTMNDPEDHQRGWNALGVALRKGGVALEHGTGKTLWQLYSEHPQKGARFDEMMEVMSVREKYALGDAVNWRGIKTVIDIGGGNGTIVKHLAVQHPHLETVVFERQAVIDAALRDAKSANASLAFVRGDLFDENSYKKLPKFDAVILKRILHDWSDEECIKILRNIRTIMHPKSKLLVVDCLVGDDGKDGLLAPKLMADLSMLVMVTGQERTTANFVELFKGAGLQLTKTSDITPLASIIEARTLSA